MQKIPNAIILRGQSLSHTLTHSMVVVSHEELLPAAEGRQSRRVPSCWGPRRDAYFWDASNWDVDGEADYQRFLDVAKEIGEAIARDPHPAWSELLPGTMAEVLGTDSAIYLSDFWVAVLYHLAWNGKLPYEAELVYEVGASGDERFMFRSRLPVDLARATTDALTLFDEASQTGRTRPIQEPVVKAAAGPVADQQAPAGPASSAGDVATRKDMRATPPYFLALRLPYMLLGADAASDPDRVLEPQLTHEKKAHVFYEVDSQTVAKRLLDLFRYDKPSPGIPSDPAQPVFELLDGAELDLPQRVLYRQEAEWIERVSHFYAYHLDDGESLIETKCPTDRITQLLVDKYRQAEQWEPLIRDELDVARGEGRSFYLWWTWGSVYPQESTADLNERSYFYRVATKDVAARLYSAFERENGDDFRFGYTVSEALDIDEVVLANDSIAKYRRREFQGGDNDFFWTAREWETHLPALGGSAPSAGNANEPKTTAKGSARNSRPSDPEWDRAPFDLPEIDEYKRVGPLNLATIIDRWEIAVEKLAQALVEGNSDEVRAIASKYSMEKVSNLIRLAMEDRGISCDSTIRLCRLFGQAASGFHVEIEKGWLDDVIADTERLKTKSALELAPMAEIAGQGDHPAVGHVKSGAGAGSAGDTTADTGSWVFEDLPDGEVRARNRRLCERYAALNLEDLLLLCHQWRQMAIRFTAATKKAGKYHGHVVHDEKVHEVTKILETALVSRQMEGANRLSRCLRRPDDGHLHHALAALDVLEAKLRVETCESGVPKPTDAVEDEIASPDPPQTVDLQAQSTECYGELEAVKGGRGVLRIFWIRKGPGKRPELRDPIGLDKQAFSILVDGVENSRRRFIEKKAGQADADGKHLDRSECAPPDEHSHDVVWDRNELAVILHNEDDYGSLTPEQKNTIKTAMGRVRKLARFKDGSRLVSNADKDGHRCLAIRLRFRKSGQP